MDEVGNVAEGVTESVQDIVNRHVDAKWHVLKATTVRMHEAMKEPIIDMDRVEKWRAKEHNDLLAWHSLYVLQRELQARGVQ